MGEPIPTDRDRAIYHRTGHYMASVAELLLRDGYPVIHVGSVQPEYMDPREDDGGGFVDFGVEVLAQVNGAPHGAVDLHLEWDTSSGWSLVAESPKGSARWMGGGLAPAPEKVAGFFLTCLLDFPNAGSEERPYYRQSGHDVDGLAERLAPHHKRGSFNDLFHRARNATTERLAVDAVVADDTVVSVPMRAGELAALQHLVRFSPIGEGLREVAVKLIEDLKARAAPLTDDGLFNAVASHSDGVEQAMKARRAREGRG